MSNTEPDISTAPTISRETACHVLSHFGRLGGYPAGDWTESLISLIDRADTANRAKLAQAYPAESEAIRMAKYDKDGIARLQQIAVGVSA